MLKCLDAEMFKCLISSQNEIGLGRQTASLR